MKRISNALLSLSICLLMIGCGSSAPFEITKATNLNELVYSSSPGLKTVVQLPDGQRFLAIEFVRKSEAEIKLKPDVVVLTDSAGKRYLPTGVAPFGELNSFQDFESIKSGTVKIQSPEGATFTVGKEQKDAPTTFSMSGKDIKGTLIFEVPTESSGFRLTVSGSSPMTVTVQ